MREVIPATAIKGAEFNMGYAAPAVSGEIDITINTEMSPEG